MKPSLQKLQKFLKLETDHGYDNRAVIGGLEKMLAPWEAEARLDGLPDATINAVTARLRDYGRLTPASRAETLEGLWKRIQRDAKEPLPPLAFPQPDGENRELAAEPAPRAPRPPVARPPAPPTAEARPPQQAAPPPPAQRPAPAMPPPPAVVAAPQVQRPAPIPEGPPAAVNAPLTVLSGVGPRHAQTLARLGLRSLGDMLFNYPRRYDDYTKLKPINRLWYGEEVTVIGQVQSVEARRVRGGSAQLVEAVVSDGSGALRVTWWNPYVAKRIRGGMQVVLSGKIEQYLGRLVMSNPEVEPLEQENLHTNRIVPVYPLTANITQRWLRKLMHQVVTYWALRMRDPLPDEVRRAAGLLDLPTALAQVHFPISWEQLKAARARLAFDEIFLLQLGVLRQKSQWQDRPGRIFTSQADWLAAQIARLPFALTRAQERALGDLQTDLASGRPMNRLLQGDVGSGKTVIAALGVAIVAREGAQAAVMAPTSILAEQHYRSFIRLLAEDTPRPSPLPAEEGETTLSNPLPIEVEETTDVSVLQSVEQDAAHTNPLPLGEGEDPQADLPPAGDEGNAPPIPPPMLLSQIRLLVGATPEAEKAEIRARLASGAVKLVIGTHALIEDPIQFQDLQLVVVDEQHRFGVEQRSALRAKGQNPHLLVMTATPIPRSLALTVYGDLDLSVMDELPPGRQVIETQVFFPRERERAYSLIRSQAQQGRQAFIIYPLVEESENSEAKAAVEEHARLQRDIFPNLRLDLLHGRMKPDEKDAVMAAFRDGQTHILVSTSVVEVGVDVPNATVMLIEGANHFGLSQLHQFRGRVGRGENQSFCILIPATPDDSENARLSAMVETNDGFVLAEKDLEQRGPGDFLGTRQAGFSELKLASLTDVRLIEKARTQAQALFTRDPQLSLPEHRLLLSALQRFWREGQGDIS